MGGDAYLVPCPDSLFLLSTSYANIAYSVIKYPLLPHVISCDEQAGLGSLCLVILVLDPVYTCPVASSNFVYQHFHRNG